MNDAPLLPPRRRFGQHFLHDPGILRRIVAAIDPAPDDVLVEIGPGRGALTQFLLERTDHLTVVELDRDLLAGLHRLAPAERLTIHGADALRFDFTQCLPATPAFSQEGPSPASPPQVAPRLRVVGNLPYNISTPLLFHLLEQASVIQDMHFLLQKEVVDRLAAAPGSKAYGRLTVMIGARAEVTPLFTVGPGAFHPPPKVNSALVRLRLYPASRVPPTAEATFRGLVGQAFSQRRKTLRRALAGWLDSDVLAAVGIDEQRRPDTLTVEDYIALAVALNQAVPNLPTRPEELPA
jgi:16S rRNA (adenine1518-N6/adenine1519-N6)-dimethyltransferase